MPWSKAANEDGTSKYDDELRALYTGVGLDESKPTIAYCRIGERSSHTWFRAARVAGDVRRQKLRRFLDRVRFIGRRIDRVGQQRLIAMCGAPEQTQELPSGTDLSERTVLTGTVRTAGEPVSGAFVRRLDGTGEFTAEVVSSASGQFRFFIAPGQRAIRALYRSGNGEALATADGPGLFSVDVAVS